MASIWMGLFEVEWDDTKAASNLQKHGIFEEAATVFQDEHGLYQVDSKHSDYELRFLLIGVSSKRKMMAVVHVERSYLRLRIISARSPTMKETRDYEQTILGRHEMREEYDFSHAVPNPYAKLARNGPLVRLEADVLKVFPDSAAVNTALRMLITVARSARVVDAPGSAKGHEQAERLVPTST